MQIVEWHVLRTPYAALPAAHRWRQMTNAIRNVPHPVSNITAHLCWTLRDMCGAYQADNEIPGIYFTTSIVCNSTRCAQAPESFGHLRRHGALRSPSPASSEYDYMLSMPPKSEKDCALSTAYPPLPCCTSCALGGCGVHPQCWGVPILGTAQATWHIV